MHDVEVLAHRDLGAITAETVAVRGERLELVGELVEDGDVRFDSSAYWATIRSVFFSPEPPIMIGMRLIGGGWLIALVHRVVLAVERRPFVAQHRDDDLQRFLELLEAVGERAELEPE